MDETKSTPVPNYDLSKSDQVATMSENAKTRLVRTKEEMS
jgi:hypothetical protein